MNLTITRPSEDTTTLEWVLVGGTRARACRPLEATPTRTHAGNRHNCIQARVRLKRRNQYVRRPTARKIHLPILRLW
jgi:hypothetical protein